MPATRKGPKGYSVSLPSRFFLLTIKSTTLPSTEAISTARKSFSQPRKNPRRGDELDVSAAQPLPFQDPDAPGEEEQEHRAAAHCADQAAEGRNAVVRQAGGSP